MTYTVASFETHVAGNAATFLGFSPDGRYTAVFEDDGESGYFYSIDRSRGAATIQDALHIYDARVFAADRSHLELKIAWSTDGCAAALFIDGEAHAVFDFDARRGYCRSGQPHPPAGARWSPSGHDWNGTALKAFA